MALSCCILVSAPTTESLNEHLRSNSIPLGIIGGLFNGSRILKVLREDSCSCLVQLSTIEFCIFSNFIPLSLAQFTCHTTKLCKKASRIELVLYSPSKWPNMCI